MATRSDMYDIHEASNSGFMIYDTEALAYMFDDDGRALVFESKDAAKGYIKRTNYNVYAATDSVYPERWFTPGFMVYDTDALGDLVSHDGAALVFASKAEAEEYINAIIGEEENFYDY